MHRKIFSIPLLFCILVFVAIAGCTSEKPVEKGTVQFTSTPGGGLIYLDGQFRGSTPATITNIDPGNHTLEIRYPGYQTFSAVMAVAPGQNNVFAALTPIPAGTAGSTQAGAPVTTTVPPVSLTLQLGRDSMVIGDSIQFTGQATGMDHVLLTLYGPGIYTDGISLPTADVNNLGTYSYTWNPGSSLLAGTYTIIATDPGRTVQQRKEFTVTGGGVVTVISNSYSAAKGDTLRFSGICTTGAKNVNLVLYGPDRYAGGVELGTISVLADKNWNFRYTLDTTMPTGVYTMYVYDIPKTTSGTVQFTVGYRGP